MAVALSAFIAYASVDRRRVWPLVKALRADGVTVFWDVDMPKGADSFDWINAKLKSADAVIACWSKHAKKSGFVKSEAVAAKSAEKLLVALLDREQPENPLNCDNFTDLMGWGGWRSDPDYLDLLRALGQLPTDRRRRARAHAARVTALLSVPLALACTQLSDGLERVILHGPFIQLIGERVKLRDVAILPIPEQEYRGRFIDLRAEYPHVLTALREAGATAVLFDMFFESCHKKDERLDPGFAAAIDSLSSAAAHRDGLVVALGLSQQLGRLNPCPKLVASAAQWVNLDFQRDVRVLDIARFAEPYLGARLGPNLKALDKPPWHAGVLMAAAHRGKQKDISVSANALRIGTWTLPLSLGWLPLAPVEPPQPSDFLSWEDPGRGASHKVVIIGALEGDDKRGLAGTVPGAALHAGLIQELLDERVPWDSRWPGTLALTAGAGALAALTRTRTRSSRRVHVALLTLPLVLLVAWLAARSVLVSVIPAFLAVTLATRSFRPAAR